MTTPAVSDPTSHTVHVRVNGACVHFGDHAALAPCTFELLPGTSVALVGANGSGKTTLLSLLAGLLTPTEGTVDVVGGVALVAQQHHHHRWMPLSVDEVLRIGRYRERGLLGRLDARDRALVDAAAGALEVGHLRRRPFGELSGGQQQRVLVAQALAADPDILLLDEPITGLDLPSQLRILDVVDRHRSEGGIVVYSTHHLTEARRADRVMLMAGCVLADGTPRDVLVPALLAEAFGGRLIRDDGSTVVIDDHGHDHDHDDEPELRPDEPLPHREFHDHERRHDHDDHDHDRRHGAERGAGDDRTVP